MPAQSDLPVLDVARPLTEAGLNVLLLRGKIPATEHGYMDATGDLAKLEELALQSPDALNVGIAPGQSGILVLDLDETKPVEKVPALIRLQQVAAAHGGIPPTLTVRTGSGGRHLYFRAHPTRVLGQANGVRNELGRTESGVDYRGVKGYVVAPPSVHPVTGKEYRWETPSGQFEPDRMLPLPDWLAEFLDPPKAQLKSPGWDPPKEAPSAHDQRRVAGMVQTACDQIARLGEGMGRRTEIQRAAYRLAGLCWTGYPVESLRGSLQSAAHACGHWDTDTQRCIDDAIRDGLEKSYPLPPDSAEYMMKRTAWPDLSEALKTWARVFRRDDEADDGHIVTTEERAMNAPLVVKIPGSTTWFLRTSSGYVTVDRDLLRIEVNRLHPEVVTTIEIDDTKRAMNAVDLFTAYGRRADSLIYDMNAERTSFRPGPDGGGELVLRCCELDPLLDAKYDEDVDRWLSKLAGDRYHRLLDWLATSTDLTRPTAALYLQGKGGAGKGMLAGGITRMFGLARCSYADVVIGAYNSALKKSPIVFLDERAPESNNGSAGFRSLLGDSERPLTEKYRPTATIRGCPRLVIASNNADALRLSGEDLTPEDEEAIARRILYIPIAEDCTAWLEEQGGRDWTNDWVDDGDLPGRIPRHILWLVKNWKVTQPGTRFLVEGEPGDWFIKIGAKTGLAQSILVAIATCANGLDMSWSVTDRPVLYRKGWVVVRSEPLRERWQAIMAEDRVPSHKAVGGALSKLCADKPARRKHPDKELGRVQGYRIDGQLVIEAAERLGVGDPDEIRKRLGMTGEPSTDDEVA